MAAGNVSEYVQHMAMFETWKHETWSQFKIVDLIVCLREVFMSYDEASFTMFECNVQWD